MYTFQSRIRFSECDQNARLTPEALLNYFQDCSTFQSEDGQIGVDYLKEHHTAWVVSFWQIVMEKMPKLGENVTIATLPYELAGAIGKRNYYMEDEKKNRLAVANSIWCYLDLEKGFPIRVPEEMYGVYQLDTPLDMDRCPRKLKFPGTVKMGMTETKNADVNTTERNAAKMNREEKKKSDVKTADPVVIGLEHLDTNRHVNNGQYVRMALSIAENEGMKNIREIRAEFLKQAVWGDTIYPVYTENEGGFFVSLNSEAGKPYTVVQML